MYGPTGQDPGLAAVEERRWEEAGMVGLAEMIVYEGHQG